MGKDLPDRPPRRTTKRRSKGNRDKRLNPCARIPRCFRSRHRPRYPAKTERLQSPARQNSDCSPQKANVCATIDFIPDPCRACSKRARNLRKTDGQSEEHTSELQSPYDLVCRL